MHFVDNIAPGAVGVAGRRQPRGTSAPRRGRRDLGPARRPTLAAAAILVLFTFTDYGVTWDEDVHNWYGVLALDYYLSLFADQRALHWLDLYHYGAAFDMVAAALNRFSPLGVYETRHLLNGFVGIIGLAGCWKLGRALGGPRAGFFALLFLLADPELLRADVQQPEGHPVCRRWRVGELLYGAHPADPAAPAAAAGRQDGVAIGLALGVRVGGLLFLCYLGLLLGLSAGWQGMAARRLAVAIAGGMDEPLARAAAGRRDRVRDHAGVLAVGAAGPDRQSAARPRLLFASRHFPSTPCSMAALCRPAICPGNTCRPISCLALPELVLVLLIAAVVLVADWADRGKASGGVRPCWRSSFWALRSSSR